MIYLKLFLSFLQIGLFSFGGGYAAMPLIREQVVSQHDWLTMTEFTDLITISQMPPAVLAPIASARIAILHTACWTDGIVQFAATKWFMVVIFGICLLLLRKTKLNPVVVMMLAGVMNVAVRYAAG